MVKLQEVSYGYEQVMFGQAELDFTNQITEVLGISVPDDAIGSDTMRVQLAMVRCAPGVASPSCFGRTVVLGRAGHPELLHRAVAKRRGEKLLVLAPQAMYAAGLTLLNTPTRARSQASRLLHTLGGG